MMIAPPASVYASGTARQISQSSATAQASAVYSNGATADAWPWRKASVMASWPRKPLIASATSNGVCVGATAIYCGAASTLPSSVIASVVQNTSVASGSLRLTMRPTTFDTA